jgi:flavin prenyltransferase
MPTTRPIVLGITGASGAIYATRLLEVLVGLGHHVHLTISRSGRTLLQQELGLDIALDRFDAGLLGLNVSAESLARITYHHFADFLSPIASGSALTAGMVICPCSGGTLSAVALGSSTNLVQRAADVHLKERRKLILVTRETPLSLIHLDNMKRACEAGAVVLPASPGWYHGVSQVGQLVDFVVARILDQLEVEHQLSQRWGSAPSGLAERGER